MLKVRPKLRVLIVDDSELNREMLGSMLGDEYEILEAENGVQAVEIMREHVSNLSLILLDVQMPQMDGLELLKHMGRLHWIDVIPVIMISSETAPQFIERAYDLGATDYIARPYNTMIVRRRVANVILSFARQRQLMEIITQQISKRKRTIGSCFPSCPISWNSAMEKVGFMSYISISLLTFCFDSIC